MVAGPGDMEIGAGHHEEVGTQFVFLGAIDRRTDSDKMSSAEGNDSTSHSITLEPVKSMTFLLPGNYRDGDKDDGDGKQEHPDSLLELKKASLARINNNENNLDDALSQFPFFDRVFHGAWELFKKPPNAIFSIIGDATDDDGEGLELMKRILAPLNNVMLLTSGTQGGVAESIAGKALQWGKEPELVSADAEYRAKYFGVGVAAAKLIDSANQLKRTDVTEWRYVLPDVDAGANHLNPFHTFFLLVETNAADQPHAQDDVRLHLERAMIKMQHQFALILFGGDEDSLQRVFKSISGSPPLPCIVVEGSGGAADQLAELKKRSGKNSSPSASLSPDAKWLDDAHCGKEEYLEWIYVLALGNTLEDDFDADPLCVSPENKLTTLKLAVKLGLTSRIKVCVKELAGAEELASILTSLFLSQDDKAMDCVKTIVNSVPTQRLDKAIITIADSPENKMTTLELAIKLGLTPRIKAAANELAGAEELANILTDLFLSRDEGSMLSIKSTFESVPKQQLDRVIARVATHNLSRLYEKKNFPDCVQNRISAYNDRCKRCWCCARRSGGDDDGGSEVINIASLENVLDRFKVAVPPKLYGEISITRDPRGHLKFCKHPKSTGVKEIHWIKLLLWALISGRLELALLIVATNVSHQMGAALFACCILKRMRELSETAQSFELQIKALKDCSKKFEAVAWNILDSCHKTSPYRSKFLLLQTLDEFRGESVISLAYKANCLDFIAHDACQQHLHNIWYGMMSPETGFFKIFLMAWIPFLIPLFANQRFKCKEEADTKRLVNGSHIGRGIYSKLLSGGLRGDLYEIGIDPGKADGPNYWIRLHNFYHSAVVKFVFHFTFNLIYLGMLAHLICEIEPVPWASGFDPAGDHLHRLEIFVILFWVNNFLQEFAQLASEKPKNWGLKWIEHYEYSKHATGFLFNYMDLFIIIATLAVFVVRLALLYSLEEEEMVTPYNAFILHHLYIAIFMIFAVRRLQTYLFFSEMGPKILMLRGIFVDFFHFLTILLVFWAAYGIGSFAMMRPLKASVGLDADFWTEYVTKFILDPYWALFGSNTDFSEELDDSNANATMTNANATLTPTEEHIKVITEFILPTAQAIYMLFGTFLLLNLIIALFSNTIERVNKDSEKFWKFSRVEMVYEYQSKPLVPPPFSMISLVIYIGIWIYQKIKGDDAEIFRAQIISATTYLDLERMSVVRHRRPRREVNRFLQLLETYEMGQAKKIDWTTLKPFHESGEPQSES